MSFFQDSGGATEEKKTESLILTDQAFELVERRRHVLDKQITDINEPVAMPYQGVERTVSGNGDLGRRVHSDLYDGFGKQTCWLQYRTLASAKHLSRWE